MKITSSGGGTIFLKSSGFFHSQYMDVKMSFFKKLDYVKEKSISGFVKINTVAHGKKSVNIFRMRF